MIVGWREVSARPSIIRTSLLMGASSSKAEIISTKETSTKFVKELKKKKSNVGGKKCFRNRHLQVDCPNRRVMTHKKLSKLIWNFKRLSKEQTKLSLELRSKMRSWNKLMKMSCWSSGRL